MSNRDCKARQVNDQMICRACGFVWDITDPEPPECAPRKQSVPRRRQRIPRFLLSVKPIPQP